MEKILRPLAWVELIGGVIVSFISAQFGGIAPKEVKITYVMERNWPLSIAIFICVLFFAFSGFAVLMAIAEILDRETYLLQKIQQLNIPQPHENLPADGWQCPKCSKYNHLYVGTCSCGASKPS